jgi:hypothetical protein
MEGRDRREENSQEGGKDPSLKGAFHGVDGVD